MSEENKINQPVEDVFSNVNEAPNSVTPVSPEPEEKAQESIDISEASLGQTAPIDAKQKNEAIGEPQVYQGVKEEGFKMGKILFYLILSLIVVLGAFAIWALVF
jgi:hypothetical protein